MSAIVARSTGGFSTGDRRPSEFSRTVPSEYVFPSRQGTRKGHLFDLRKPFEKACQRAGVENFRIHDLRHTFGITGDAFDFLELLCTCVEGTQRRPPLHTLCTLGSSLDLQTAIEEKAFGLEANVFSGYIIVVEDSSASRANPRIKMKYFPVMEGFLADEGERGVTYVPKADGTYPNAKGISYIERYDMMCKRLMVKKMYTATAVITSPKPEVGVSRCYDHISKETSIEAFLIKLSKHCEGIADMKKIL